jgi:hypothetical protein
VAWPPREAVSTGLVATEVATPADVRHNEREIVD